MMLADNAFYYAPMSHIKSKIRPVKKMSPKLASAYEQRLLRAAADLNAVALEHILQTCPGSGALVDHCDILSRVARGGSFACVSTLMPHSSAAKCSRSLSSAAASGSQECLSLLLSHPDIDNGQLWGGDVSEAICSAIRYNHNYCIEMLAPLIDAPDLCEYMEKPLLLAVVLDQDDSCFNAILAFCHAGALSSVLASVEAHPHGHFIEARRSFIEAIRSRLSIQVERAAIADSSADGFSGASRCLRI